MRLEVLGAGLDTVAGDPARLKQILFNLIGNAIKFTENGSVTVELERDPGTETVDFRVVDTGIGMDEADFDRVFEDFVTLDTSFHREVEGTGLGLGIVRRLVKLLGGELGVESSRGEGPAFWFRLPLPKVERAAPAPGVAPGPRQRAPADAMRVLLWRTTASTASSPAKFLPRSAAKSQKRTTASTGSISRPSARSISSRWISACRGSTVSKRAA